MVRAQKIWQRLFIFLFAAVLLFASNRPVYADAGTLQQDVNALNNGGVVGVLARVTDHGEVTTATSGVAQLNTSQPVPQNARFRMGSVTKTFVSTVVLQMVGEGKLSLDDTVEHWLPGVITGNGNDGAHITVRQLLNNTSGLFDYVNDDSFFSTLDTPSAFYANRYHHYSPQDLIAIAVAHPPYFAPGTSWAYSNTNFVVAGEIIKAVGGNTWETEVTNRIIIPLGLTGTTAPGDDPTIQGNHAQGYHIFTQNPSDRTYSDTTDHNMTWAGAGGALITTPSDTNMFFTALLSGQLLEPQELAELKTVVPIASGVGYGLGIVRQELSCSATPIWWHNGGTVGYATWVGTTDDGSRSLTLSLSTTTFSDDPYTSLTNNHTDTLIRHVFCGSQ